MDLHTETQPDFQAQLHHQLAQKGLSLQSKTTTKRLLSGAPTLDQFLGGGLPWGQISEWGLPLGKGGRHWVLPYLRVASQKNWCLWVSGYEDCEVFPPAFFAQGVRADRLVFAQTRHPIQDLHAALIHPLFRMIVLDGSLGLTPGALAFIEAKAREQGQAVLVLRPYRLSNDQGNVWAKFRVNGWRENTGGYVLQAVRGLSRPTLLWDGQG